MLQVVIVGDPGFGKTTFLGLLYTTQVRLGSDKAGEFRFHTPVESLDSITFVFQQLMSGSFPDSVTKQGVTEIDFRFGPRRSGLGLSRLRGRSRDPDSFPTIHFTLTKAPVGEISGQLLGTSVVDERSKNIYNSDALAILVDSTKLAPSDEALERPLSGYDAAVESLLTLMQRLGDRSSRRLLHPILVFSKFDRLNPEVLRSAGLAATPPNVGDVRPRAVYAEALLHRNLPRTLAKVKAPDVGGRKFAKPVYVFSWVRTDAGGSGEPDRIRLHRRNLGGWEMDYASHEYVALLEHLGNIASRSGA